MHALSSLWAALGPIVPRRDGGLRCLSSSPARHAVPGFPATFEHHDLTPGGTITYSMSGPDGGERFDGTWNVIEVDAPTRLVVEDAIVEDDGTPSDGNAMTRMEIDIEAAGDTTLMILTTHVDSLEGMEQAIATGVAEGMKPCMSQMDALLAEVVA